MRYKGFRIAIGVLTGFIALTAIGGGIALLTGAEANRLPIEWLEGTLFRDYTIPALVLAIAVGGSSLAACVTTIAGRNVGTLASKGNAGSYTGCGSRVAAEV